jgi:chromate reductase
MGALKILGFAGSLRRLSTNRGLLRAAVRAAPAGVLLETFDLAPIPVYNGDLEANPPAAVVEFVQRIRAADAILIVTPEYNFSISGVLKNAIDWSSRVEMGHGPVFRGKPIGIIGASTGPLGTARAQYDLRRVLQGFESHPMPRPELFVTFSSGKFDPQGDLIDEEIRRALTKWMAAFAAWAERIRSLPDLS